MLISRSKSERWPTSLVVVVIVVLIRATAQVVCFFDLLQVLLGLEIWVHLFGCVQNVEVVTTHVILPVLVERGGRVLGLGRPGFCELAVREWGPFVVILSLGNLTHLSAVLVLVVPVMRPGAGAERQGGEAKCAEGGGGHGVCVETLRCSARKWR